MKTKTGKENSRSRDTAALSLLTVATYSRRRLDGRDICKLAPNRATFISSCRPPPYRSPLLEVRFIQLDVSTHATCNRLICCKTGLKLGDKTRNITFQIVWQQCCKTSCTFVARFIVHCSLSIFLCIFNLPLVRNHGKACQCVAAGIVRYTPDCWHLTLCALRSTHCK